MNTASIGKRSAGMSGPRPAGQGFARELARAEKRSRAESPGGAARRSRAGNEEPGAHRPITSALAVSREALQRRRGDADVKDDRLAERRGIDRSAELATERSLVPLQAETCAEPPSAASLAAAVEHLELALERQRSAEGPSLEMQFGGRLRIRLTRGPIGLELAISGDAAAARLAQAELPDLLERLRQRGLAISRAQVQGQGRPTAVSRGQPPPDAFIDAGTGVR